MYTMRRKIDCLHPCLVLSFPLFRFYCRSLLGLASNCQYQQPASPSVPNPSLSDKNTAMVDDTHDSFLSKQMYPDLSDYECSHCTYAFDCSTWIRQSNTTPCPPSETTANQEHPFQMLCLDLDRMRHLVLDMHLGT